MAYVTCDVMISADGFSSGPGETVSVERPFGDGDIGQLLRWRFEAGDENRAEIDGIVGADAYIMGRTMFGPSGAGGDWDSGWTGWWEDEPPFRAPVFVLTHHERDDLALTGTTFHFVTGGLAEAYGRAAEVAGDGRIAIAGGASVINQALAAGLVDELRLHISPLTLGRGERIFDGVPPLRLEQLGGRVSALVTHVTYRVLNDEKS
jgi:dihydrofolate reductase